jgi:hypothetical protein
VQKFLQEPSDQAEKIFMGEAYVHRGHTTMLAQAAEVRPGSGFTCHELSIKAAKKYARLAIRKAVAGQGSSSAVMQHDEARNKAKADASELLKQLQTFRVAIEEARLSKQPPVDVSKYERMLCALGSDAAGVRSEACDKQAQQRRLDPVDSGYAWLHASIVGCAAQPPELELELAQAEVRPRLGDGVGRAGVAQQALTQLCAVERCQHGHLGLVDAAHDGRTQRQIKVLRHPLGQALAS